MSSEEFDFDDQFSQILDASENISQKKNKPTVVGDAVAFVMSSLRASRASIV